MPLEVDVLVLVLVDVDVDVEVLELDAEEELELATLVDPVDPVLLELSQPAMPPAITVTTDMHPRNRFNLIRPPSTSEALASPGEGISRPRDRPGPARSPMRRREIPNHIE
jgi:hypothetical protein